MQLKPKVGRAYRPTLPPVLNPATEAPGRAYRPESHASRIEGVGRAYRPKAGLPVVVGFWVRRCNKNHFNLRNKTRP